MVKSLPGPVFKIPELECPLCKPAAICPSCKSVHSFTEWDEKTQEQCLNRKERRAYTPIGSRLSNKWYVCPSCGRQIKIEGIEFGHRD